MEKLNFVSASNRYRIAKYCPCGKLNRDGKFCPDKENPNAGYCHSCGKTFLGTAVNKTYLSSLPTIEKPATYHPIEIMRRSLKGYDNNNLIAFCKRLFPTKDVEGLAKVYGIGTSNLYKGNSTIFWQIDTEKNVRGGKIIKYNSINGKRLKEPKVFPAVTWVHSILKLSDFNLKQCLFGCHLLAENTKGIAIVESEKTAFIMAIVDNSRIWLATGAKDNFKYDLLKCLKGRNVTAYPDNGEFELWHKRATSLSIYGIKIKVSNLLESTANPQGWDLADEIIFSLKSQS